MAFADLVELTDRAAIQHLGGVSVSYAPEVGAPVIVEGLFDQNYVHIDGEAGVEQIGPAVFFRVEDLPGTPDVDDPTITVNGNSYRARERMPDSHGGIMMLLHRVGI